MYTVTQSSKGSVRGRVAQRLRDNEAPILVFNGGTEPAILVHQACTYVFGPDGPWLGPEGEFVQCDGITEVRSVRGAAPGAVLDARRAKKPFAAIPKDTVIVTAEAIAEHAEVKLRGRGVVVLTGDVRLDEKLKADAREAWVQYRLVRAEKTVENYRKRTAGFFADPRTQGHQPPSMTDAETNEQIYLDEYRAGMVKGRRYVCTYKCGFQHDDESVMTRHIRVAHPVSQDDQRTAALMSQS
jgi:hypothetical protein